MSLSTKLFGLFLLSLTLGVVGCTPGGGSDEAVAPAQDELTQFLNDNPDVAEGIEEPIDDQY